MESEKRLKLETPLTPHEIAWVEELAGRLPDDVDVTFEEAKILTRISIRDWPDDLLVKVKDVIDIEDFLTEYPEEHL